jgi:hypothetical protein
MNMKKEGWSGGELPELDNYNNASGGRFCFLKSGSKKEECLKAQSERKDEKPKTLEAQAELLTAQAVLSKSQQATEQGLSPMAITGIVVASLLTITLMVVVIKRTRAKKA